MLSDSLIATGVHTLTDPDEIDLYTHDIFSDTGADLAAVVRPTDKQQLRQSIGAATDAGHSVVPRGGGMSYTGGYTPAKPGAVLIDVSAMDRVIAVEPTDMTVTVEPGCTWARLHETLAPMGLRTRMWGTLSGLKATVGGGMSQNAMFWGSGRHGSAALSCYSLEIVLADGSLMSVGKPHIRPYGPDLVGLFLADCGAFGIKSEITLRLDQIPANSDGASFSFDSATAWIAAASAIERSGTATECFGFDPNLNEIRMQRESLLGDAKKLAGVLTRQGGVIEGLKAGAKVIRAGRGFLQPYSFALHVLAEGRSRASVDADMNALRKIASDHNGKEIENSIPTVVRANPFSPLNAVIAPDGKRWAPVHGHLRHGAVIACHEDLERLFERRREAMDKHSIVIGTLMAIVGGAGVVLEPCLYWPDKRNPLIDHTIEPSYLKSLPNLESRPKARSVVEELRAEIIDVFAKHGAAHFQIGRTYPYLASLDPLARDLVISIKRTLDPQGLMNGGVLGLEA